MHSRISNRFRASVLICLSAALLVFASFSTARAGFIGDVVTVSVSAGSDSGSWSANVIPTTDPFGWTLPGPVDILGADNVTVLATVTNMTVNLDGDPQAFVVFGVAAGALPTNFSISSALVAFAPLNNPQATASGQVGLTDLNGNGATVNGNFAGAKAFEARYNGASIFADLVSTPIVAPPNGSNGASESFPLIGTTPIAGAVSNIQVEFNFLLSAGDTASGTGVFTVIVPEPSAIVLAAMGCLGLAVWARRRRRK